MGTLSPYTGLSVASGVTLEPPGLSAGSGLSLETQVDTELYVTLNALAKPPNETNATTGFTSTNAPATFQSIATTDSSEEGDFMIFLSEPGGNSGFHEVQNLSSSLSLTTETIYLFTVRASWGGVGGASDDVSMRFSNSSTLQVVDASYLLAELVEAGGDDTFNEYTAILYLAGTHPLDYFGWTDSNANDIGSVKASVVSLTQPSISLGPELNTIGNATSPTNEMNATTGWSVDGTAAILVSETSTDSLAGGSYMLHINDTGNAWRAVTDLQTDLFLEDGKHYMLSYRAAHDGSGVSGDVVRAVLAENSNLASIRTVYDQDYPITTTSFADYTFAFTHKTDLTRYFGGRESNPNDGGGIYISKVSVKEILL